MSDEASDETSDEDSSDESHAVEVGNIEDSLIASAGIKNIKQNVVNVDILNTICLQDCVSISIIINYLYYGWS